MASSFLLGLMNSITLWYRNNGRYSIEEIGTQVNLLLSSGLSI
ncbi:hypothetical protein ACFLXL_00745 [Chloroflexota bacterium]